MTNNSDCQCWICKTGIFQKYEQLKKDNPQPLVEYKIQEGDSVE